MACPSTSCSSEALAPPVAAAGSRGTPGAGGGSVGAGGTANLSSTFDGVQTILGQNCALFGCHDGSTSHNNLTPNATLYARLTTPLATMACQGRTLIVPGDVAASLLPQMVGGSPPCAVRMPNQCSPTGTPRACLSDAQRQAIEGWIEAGAPEQ